MIVMFNKSKIKIGCHYLMVLFLCVSTQYRVEASDRGISVIGDLTHQSGKLGKYIALIIGINDYQDPEIPNLATAVHDATIMADLLRNQYGFQVQLLLDQKATRKAIYLALRRLVNSTESNDSVVIYYAGHGDLDRTYNDGWWIPADAVGGDPLTYLENVQVQKAMRSMKARHVLLISDSCFSGSLFGRTRAMPQVIDDKYYMNLYNEKSRWGMTSGNKTPVSDLGRGGHSVFAYQLIKELTDNRKPFITAQELYTRIAPIVSNNSEQTPLCRPIRGVGDQGGEFIFVSTNEGKAGRPLKGKIVDQISIDDQRRQLESERKALERLKIELEHKKIEAERQRIQSERRRIAEKKNELSGSSSTQYAAVSAKAKNEHLEFMTIDSILKDEIVQSGELRVGFESGYLPFEMTDKKGKFIGFDIDIPKEMAKEMGVTFVPVNTQWEGIIPTLIQGKFDIIIGGMTITEERKKVIDFSAPYIIVGNTILLHPKHRGKVLSYNDLNDPKYVITSRMGTTGELIIKRKIPKAIYKGYQSETEAAMRVVNGHADAFVYDLPFCSLFLASTGADKLIHLNDPIVSESLGFAIRKGNPEFVAWLNRFLVQIKRDGRYETIYDRWMNRVDWKDELR